MTDPHPPAQLLPCPFCGNEAGKPFEVQGHKNDGWWRICCDSCEVELQGLTTAERAIAAWNRRPHPPAQDHQPVDGEVIARIIDPEAFLSYAEAIKRAGKEIPPAEGAWTGIDFSQPRPMLALRRDQALAKAADILALIQPTTGSVGEDEIGQRGDRWERNDLRTRLEAATSEALASMEEIANLRGENERMRLERDIMVDLHQRLIPLSGHRGDTHPTFIEWLKLTREAGEKLFALAGQSSILLDTLADHVQAQVANQEVERLRAALGQWKCPSCGGAKVYTHRSRDNGTEIVPCKVCEETGLHLTARLALAPVGGGLGSVASVASSNLVASPSLETDCKPEGK